MSKDVFIVGSSAYTPPASSLEDIFDKIIPEKYQGICARLLGKTDKKYKNTILKTSVLPKRQASEGQSPIEWAQNLFSKQSIELGIKAKNIGYFGTAYNVSSHEQQLPNLSCQIAQKLQLPNVLAPKHHVEYGCAAGFIALEEAYNYCQKHDQPAIIFVFDQCTWGVNFNAMNDQNFKDMLKSYFLFSDAATMMVLMNEDCLKNYSPKNKMKLSCIQNSFQQSEILNLNEEGMHFNKSISDILPKMLDQAIVAPLLQQENTSLVNISNFCCHTGGRPILNSIKKYFNLSDDQIDLSFQTLNEYGNTSAASIFLTINMLWEQHKESIHKAAFEKTSIGLSFGSGFYMGGIILQHN